MIKNLTKLQNELVCPKGQFNSFAKYAFRNTSDILMTVKPLLLKYNLQMVITDDLVQVGQNVYIKATVKITDEDGNSETVSAFAREGTDGKRALDPSQQTGSCSTYARRYALCALFAISDSSLDPDSDEYHTKTTQEKEKPRKITKAFLKEHGAERIGAEEVEKLKTACLNAGESMSLERALRACNRSSVTDISWVQYVSLMSQLGAVA
jgi:hypothetical protein